MNRWNTKGTRHAKVRMAELRDTKARKATVVAAQAWCARHNVPWDTNWLAAAKAAGYPHATGLSQAQRKQWFETH